MCGERLAARGSRPLVYVYRWLDTLHRQLLGSRSSASFLDIWHPRSQFLSEFAFHRALLASPFATASPESADFFFVPFYSRLALGQKNPGELIKFDPSRPQDSCQRIIEQTG